MVTTGAVATWHLNAGGPGSPLVLAAVGGVAAGCLTGFVLEKGLFHPLRGRRMNNISLME